MPRFSLLWFVIAICVLGTTRLPAQVLGEKGAGAKGGDGPFGAPAAARFDAATNTLMQALDIDADGTISAKELRAAVRALKKLDTNRDGQLTPDELVPAAAGGAAEMAAGAAAVGAAAGADGRAVNRGARGPAGFPAGAGMSGRSGAMSRPPGTALPMSTNRIMAFDKNRDGRVSREELPDQVWNIVGRYDANRDGSLDRLELRTAGGGRR